MLMWRSVKTSRTSSWPARLSECCLDTNQHHHWTWTWHDGRLAEYENVFKYKVNTIDHTILARQGTWDVQGANCYREGWPTWLCCEEGMQLHGDRHSGLSHTSRKLFNNGRWLFFIHLSMWNVEKFLMFFAYQRKIFSDLWGLVGRRMLHPQWGGQGGRTWQAFGRGKNGHETFRQARIYNFRDKCVVFARNLKFSNLTQ